ncbi:MAG: rod shape-determining protein MreD [Lachnospiraceae bacterium]|nr:rod shape-determining protein MreD [Lachnospiraceae bacterium]
MIFKVLLILFEIILSYLLQTSVFSNLTLADVVPDIFMILTASLGYISGKNTAAVTGFVSGMILDLTFGNLIGVYALMYTVIGYICGFSNRIYDNEDYTLPLFIIGSAEFLYNLMYFVLFHLLLGKVDIGYFMMRFLFPRVIYTVTVSIILYRLLNFNFNIFEKIDRKKRIKRGEVIEYSGFDFVGRRGL